MTMQDKCLKNLKQMMKNNFLIGMILIASMCYSQDNFPVLKGSYFGQTPPGNTPEVFVPGIISTLDKYELNSVFSPDGNEFYYEISTTTPEEKKQGKYFYVIMVSKNINGQWIKPEMAEFSGKFSTYDLCFAPDGERIYFTSDRDDPWNDTKENHIWFVNKTKNGWSDAKILGPPVFSNEGESQMTITKDGSMIFRKGDDLFFSQNENGIFKEPVKLGEEINSPYSESEPCISPDESFLLYFRYAMPVSIDKGRGLYISFKEDDGSWSPSQNTGILGSLPKFSHDGKYFFFSRSGDVYWVNASVIHKLSIQNIINHYYIKGLKTRDLLIGHLIFRIKLIQNLI